ncbi:glycoside hydrolase family 3 C-terminal domain-containing protein [Streptomyces sp. VRA16 Mangrove soil]|uniref:glycoside hydrolase family 3 C-terminal domain-containing protein n=1 Tax=Streptomyces sp. VRA16 Mangrove soil TaxID=2817434 RepID=UPI001A9EC143|nr:glycoside hydrolase family 3 C-terminal domain-containing protein [Streptomyces sp. VRA16 Mangrove soil]MBO1330860.1 glycoside hydrolase family 3 C-terminal domain-containing protein [Streptomyces sp. VRA16 Mangrove soil]
MTERPPNAPRVAAPEGKRVDDLLAGLTLDERIALVHQNTPGVERLGLAPFRTGQEALHGVAWMGRATVFPQAIGLGATWNEDLVRRVGDAVSAEVRAMREHDDRIGLNVWAPTVNLLRHPLWGRNEEGYSEDPYLTAAIATAYTRGLRGTHPTYWRTAPVLKHWLAHNNETGRDVTSSSVRPRVLHEYDLKAFRRPVEEGAVAGVMPAYNLVNGRPNHVSPYLREHLRTWTDQELLVCSDAGAPSNLVDSEHYFDTHEEATAAALIAGVDSFTDHGTDSTKIVARVTAALEQGLLSENDIDTAVRRQLQVRARLGEFEDVDPFEDVRDFDTEAHRALAQETAEQAVVLLKNDGVLPLAADGDTRIALVGLLADECKTDWYSGTLIRRSTPLDGLYERFGTDRVTFTEGVDRVRLRGAEGWLHVPEVAADTEEHGAEGALDPALLAGRTDLPPLTTAPDEAEGTELALVDWGNDVLTLRAPDGRYLSVAEDGYVRASADQPGGWIVQETFALETHGGGHLLKHLGTGRYVSVAADGVKVADHGTVFSVEVVERGADAVARAAADADIVVVVAGNDPHINGRETEDRTTLALPAHQDGLWRAAHTANPNTLLCLVSAYPYAVPDADAALPALLWTAHGGQAAGRALARILAGDVSPAGRLPQTWYASDADLPDLLDYDVIGSRQTYLYFEGAPLYPFGHGLSYSSFRYDGLFVNRGAETLECTFTVTNTGDRAADEVPQLYVRALDTAVPRPRRQLLAHRRLTLAPGAAERVTLSVPLAELGHWDVAHDRWSVTSGTYEVLVGASSADLRLITRLTVEGDEPAPRPVLARGLDAAAYDEQCGTEIVDRTRTHGDAVTAVPGSRSELVFRDCDFGAEGVSGVRVEVAGEGTLEVGDGRPLTVPATGGPYNYVTLDADFAAAGVGDLRVRLDGPVRLARLTFVPRGASFNANEADA